MKPKKKIPKFKNEDEEREFWATHDATDYIDWESAETVDFSFLRRHPRGSSAGSLGRSREYDILSRLELALNDEQDPNLRQMFDDIYEAFERQDPRKHHLIDRLFDYVKEMYVRRH